MSEQEGICLTFYVHENRRHHHRLTYEWLLEQAEDLGIHGGSAFRSIAGFGRHGVLHEDHFFELAGELPVAVKFVVSEAEADRLLATVKKESLSLFYVRTPARFGIINGDSDAQV